MLTDLELSAQPLIGSFNFSIQFLKRSRDGFAIAACGGDPDIGHKPVHCFVPDMPELIDPLLGLIDR